MDSNYKAETQTYKITSTQNLNSIPFWIVNNKEVFIIFTINNVEEVLFIFLNDQYSCQFGSCCCWSRKPINKPENAINNAVCTTSLNAIFYVMVSKLNHCGLFPFFFLDSTFISPELQKIFERVRNGADFMPKWQLEVMVNIFLFYLSEVSWWIL